MLQRLLLAGAFFCGVVGITSQSAQAQCQQCQQSAQCQQCAERDKCCRPSRTRIIIYKSNLVSGGLSPVMGAAPPQGYAVNSVPAMMVQQPAIAIHPASFSTASFGSASYGTVGLTSSDLDRAADAAVRRHAAATASASAAVNGQSTTCQDPCGDLLQLKQDVKDLKLAIEKITIALERHQQSLPK